MSETKRGPTSRNTKRAERPEDSTVTTENTATVETTEAPAAVESNGTPHVDHINDPAASGNAKTGGKKGRGGGGKVKPKPAADSGSPAEKLADKIAEGQQKRADEQTHKAMMKGWLPGDAQTTPIKSITFDKRLQMRNLGAEVIDETTVENYRELIKDGVQFPPLKAVRVSDAEAKLYMLAGNLLVWDGFQTGEASKRAGLKDVPVEIMDGTFRFARLLALGANSKHGKQRTDADKRKALYTVIADPEMLKDAIELARTGEAGVTGGLNRSLATICGISKGAVSKYLDAKGLTTRGDKIVQKPADPTEPAAVGAGQSQGGSGGTTTPTEPGTPTATPDARQLSKEEIAATATTAVLGQMRKIVAGLQIRCESLLGRPGANNIFKELAAVYNVPVATGDPITEVRDGREVVVTPEQWPVLNYIAAVLEETEVAFAKTQTVPATPDGAVQKG